MKLSLLLLLCVAYLTTSHVVLSLRCSGEDNGCCTRDKPCDLGEGDCDRDDHCVGGLTCGHDNCPWGDGDDCCQGVKAPTSLRCKGADSGCCTAETPCLEGDGDCDDDSECAEGLKCGRDNCPWGGDGDDCCIKKKVADPCKVKNGGCSHKCVNILGSAKCVCPKLFALGPDKKTCEVADPCKVKNGGCSHTCVNILGSAKCVCPKGYALGAHKKTCTDIDECATGASKCHANAVCTNTPGGFTCKCKPGFQGNGKSCSDINECSIGASKCHANAVCTNTIGGFTCKCKPGFQGDGRSCSDINECAQRRCDRNADCRNTHGGYTCSCKSGYNGNGKPGQCRACYEMNMDYYGSDMYQIWTNTWQECGRACERTGGCGSWTWISNRYPHSHRKCHFKRGSRPGRRGTYGLISGQRNCPGNRWRGK